MKGGVYRMLTLIFLSFFGLAKEDADMLDVRVKAVMFCSNG